MWYYRKKEVSFILSDKFEGKFSNFLDSKTYDAAEETLFSLLRSAFAAGWEAAGGEPVTRD